MPNKNEERENEKMAKKLKKVFALLLTLSMVMSLLSVTALAESNENSKWKIVSDIEKSGEIIIKDADGEEAENVWYWYDTADVNTALNKKGTARLDIIDAAVESPNEKKTYFAKATIDGQEVETDEFTVPYFAALQNGSFESPVVEKSNIGWPGVYQYKNDTVPELVWKTTGLGQGKMEGRDIELVRPEGKAVYHGVKPGDIPNGKQFAELNAEAYGALYQDVLTEPGSTLNWGLAHRGRNGQDTMYVVIVNAENAAYVTKPGDVNEDCIMARITDGNRKWGYYSGEYEVPAGQYVTRFYFLAVDAAGGMSQGNLLDNVYFTAERPEKPPVTVYDYTVNYFVDGKKVESFSGTASEGALIQTYDLAITQGYVSKYDASETNVYDMTISAEGANVLNLYFTTKAPVDPVDPVDPAKLPAPVVDKKATKLDENDKTTVTLSIGAEQGKTVSDVVFVLDKSTSVDVRAAAKDMLNELMTQAGENRIKVGVVVFNRNGNRTLELTELSEENLPKIEAALDEKMSSGSNIQAGLAAGKAMLDEDKSVASGAKHLVLVSDGVTYMWGTEEPPMTIYSEQIENQCESINAGNDMMGKHHPNAAAYFAEFQDAAAWYAKYGDAISADINAYADTYESAYYKPVEQGKMENSEYDCSKYYIPGEDLAKHYCANDAAVYMTIHEWGKIVNSGYSAYAYADQKHASSYPWAPDYVESLDTIGGISGAIPADKAGMFSAVQSRILYAMDKGTVTDKIGNHFDLTTVDSFELKVGGEAVSKVVDGNTVTFDGGKYVVKYQPATADNSEEQFVWIINTPVENAKGLELSYVLKLVDKETTPGDHTALTNEEAILEYTPTEGEKGEEEFPKPEVEYNVPKDPGPGPENPAANLVVDKAAPATVKQGGELTYTITVENKGDAAAKNVVIKDTLPKGVEFKSASNEGKMADGTITWTIGELAAGEKKTVTVVVSVPSDATVGEIISNTAVVTSDDEEEPKEDTVKTEVKPKDDGKKDDDDDDDDDRKKPSDPGTDIGEDPTPLDPGPDVPGTEIPESDVPLAEVPKTGDAAALWMILAGVSALGLAVVTFTTRKKENN